MARYVAAIDQRTTSTRCMVFDHDGHEVARHQLAHEQIVPRAGWVEHDPHEIWEATQDVVEAATGRAGIGADDLAAIGIASPRGSVTVWDRRTGEPYCHAIAEHDPRSTTASAGGALPWVLENVDGVRAGAEAGHAIVGTTGSWLVWWLTGGPDGGLHLTDPTHAAHTGLMDLRTLTWDDERLAALDVPRLMLPEIGSSSQVHGRTDVDGPFSGEVEIGALLGDRNAALVGQGCFAAGEVQVTCDATSTLMVGTGTQPVGPAHGLRATIAYRLGDAPAVHALESAGVEDPHDLASAVVAAAGTDLRVVRVDGPASTDERLMQDIADRLGVPVSRPVVVESAALGAAGAAGLAVGFWSSTDELVARRHESMRWEPAGRSGG